MNWSLIISGCMMFILLSIIRLLFYLNISISNEKKIIKILSIPNMRDRDNSGEVLIFLYQCAFVLMIFIGFLHQNILRIIINVMPPIRFIEAYVTFVLSLIPLLLPVVVGLIISKIYWSNIPVQDQE
ncbi:MAG: hypothetical protein L6461_19820 [Anaerolineae bacterium]|nr:hypothetical protein [Anaerolineae bacterium]